MLPVMSVLIYYTCWCCKSDYLSEQDAENCCTRLSKIEQENLWDRKMDLFGINSKDARCLH